MVPAMYLAPYSLQALFGKTADSLERSTENEDEYMIHEREVIIDTKTPPSGASNTNRTDGPFLACTEENEELVRTSLRHRRLTLSRCLSAGCTLEILPGVVDPCLENLIPSSWLRGRLHAADAPHKYPLLYGIRFSRVCVYVGVWVCIYFCI